MRLYLKNKHAAVDLVLMLTRQFPERAVELRQLCNTAASGIKLDVLRVKNYSRSQENFYRQQCRGFATWAGLTEAELHDEVLGRCFGTEEIETKLGPRQRPMKSSKDISKEQFSELISTLVDIALEHSYSIDVPTEGDKHEAVNT